jgi:hypothetical protein
MREHWICLSSFSICAGWSIHQRSETHLFLGCEPWLAVLYQSRSWLSFLLYINCRSYLI